MGPVVTRGQSDLSFCSGTKVGLGWKCAPWAWVTTTAERTVTEQDCEVGCRGPGSCLPYMKYTLQQGHCQHSIKAGRQTLSRQQKCVLFTMVFSHHSFSLSLSLSLSLSFSLLSISLSLCLHLCVCVCVCAQKTATDGKRQEIIVLDSKRSNAINIGLTVLPPPRTIKTAILNFDEYALNKEGIEVRFLRCCYTTERRYSGHRKYICAMC